MPNFSFLGCLEEAVLWLEDNKNKTKQNNLVELVASLAPAKAEVGAVAKADQKYNRQAHKAGTNHPPAEMG